MSAFLALAFVALMFGQATSVASAQAGSEAVIGDSLIYLVQGRTSANPTLSDLDFYVLKIIDYVVPHNVTRLYSQVPDDARNISVHAIDATTGREATGPMAGTFFLDLPTTYPRNTSFNHTETAVEIPTSQLVNLSYSSGSLHLMNNQTSGTCTSVNMSVPNSYAVTRANLTIFGLNLTDNVSVALSNDAGATWIPAVGSGLVQFIQAGQTLKVKLTLFGNATLGGDPKVTGFALHADYIALTTTLTVHITYVFTPLQIDGRTTINLTEPAAYSESGVLFVMLYLVNGSSAEGQGIDLARDESGAMSAFQNKDLWLNLTAIAGGSPNIYIDVLAPPAESNPLMLYVGAGALAIVAVGAFAYIRLRKPIARSSFESVGSYDQGSGSESGSQDSSRRAELVERKKAILSELEGLKAQRKAGKDAPSPDRRLTELKGEYKEVRNELNRLRKNPPIMISSVHEPSEEYESTLALISRLDDDFQKGRLPQESYETLRKRYLSKAARLKAEMESSGGSAMLVEKTKLLEAIVSLEEERERGVIDEKVFEELNASYRKELESITRRIDEGGDGK